jgi:hypothetical protein
LVALPLQPLNEVSPFTLELTALLHAAYFPFLALNDTHSTLATDDIHRPQLHATMAPRRALLAPHNRVVRATIHGSTDLAPKVGLSAYLKVPSSTFPAAATATLAPPQSLFTFEMDPRGRAKFAPKTRKASAAFSNTRVEVSMNQKVRVKSKKDGESGNGTGWVAAESKHRVSKEEKLQRIASWRQDLPSTNANDGEREKRQSRDFSGPLKYLIEDTLEGDGSAINGHAPNTTAPNYANAAFPDQASNTYSNADMEANAFSQNERSEAQPEAWTSTQMKEFLAYLKNEQDCSADPSFTPYDDAIRELYTADDEPGHFDDWEYDEYQKNCQRVNEQEHHGNQSQVEHTHARALYSSPARANPYDQKDLDMHTSVGPSTTNHQQGLDLYNRPDLYNPHQTCAANNTIMQSPYPQDKNPTAWATQTHYAQSHIIAPVAHPSTSATVTSMPPPGYFPPFTLHPAPTPRHLTPQTIQQQRVGQTFMREETPKPPRYVHGAWPELRDLQNGVPPNPLAWKELVALRKVEDELRTSRSIHGRISADSHVGIGYRDKNTLTSDIILFGQHAQFIRSDTRIRDSGDRNFHDTQWEHTLHPDTQASVFDAHIDRTKTQHVCRCHLCQRMGKWFADPKISHLEKVSPSRESLRASSLVRKLVD